ncbi:hypothetical protein IWW55_002964 [Coemansia sp. RSA 2706]|nr:hypothetical protein IWW55_002964 [Coemansia sp. RSA 2706]KAJ2385229.1 hypothetical protein H4S02_004435 [Coemansia sp. RSA 2611]
MAFTTALISAAAAALALTASANPVPHLARRGGYGGVGYGSGYGGYSPYNSYSYGNFGYGGIGFPFASSFANAFNANNNFAHFNDDTLYVNDKDATTANNNVNTFTNANVVA